MAISVPSWKWQIFCFLVALLLCVELRADVWPVVLAGQPAPGIAGARFRGVGSPAVNASGAIVFNGGLDVTFGDVQSDGIFKVSGGELSAVAVTGQPIPGSSTDTFRVFGDPDINNSGDTAFLAVMTGQTT